LVRWPDLFRSPVGVVAALMVASVLVLAPSRRSSDAGSAG